MADHFQYRGLDPSRREIRILRIAPGRGLEPVRCSVSHVSFYDKECPQYEAISYAWDHEGITAGIFLDDQPFTIPASAEQALRRMRYADAVRTLWIDAVCINQADLVEKGEQVARMDEVYWKADEEAEFDRLLARIVLANTVPESVSVQLLPLYNSPWFGRLWVVQEVALAARCLAFAGTNELEWSDVVQVGWWLMWNSKRFRSEHRRARVFANLSRCMEISKYTGRGLGHCMLHLQAFDVTDPRDHVYGVLGLARRISVDPSSLDALYPDYAKEFDEVLRDSTLVDIAQTQSLYILHKVWHPVVTLPDDHFSSWTPRWDHEINGDEECAFFRSGYWADNGILWEPPSPSFHPRDLRVLGCTIGSIACATRIMWSRMIHDSAQFAELLQDVDVLVATSSYIQPHEEVISRTLVADWSFKPLGRLQGSEAIGKHTELYVELRRDLTAGTDTTNVLALQQSSTELDEYRYGIWWYCGNRRIFRTECGRVGLGPQAMLEQDQG
ncbi:hypothetical protein LTR95_000790 [Oleoguttula sp. CCFEE 5521]